MGSSQSSIPPDSLSQAVGLALLSQHQTHTQVVLTDGAERTLWVNPLFTEVSGYSLEEMLGKIPGHVLQGADTDPKTVKAIQMAIEKRERFSVEILNYTKAGKPYWNHLEVCPIHDANGELIHFLGLQREITQEKLNRQQLELLEACVSRLNDVVLITEAEPLAPPGPRILYVNDTFERHTGYTREEALGQTPRMLQSPRTNRAELDRLRAALKAWQPIRVELINQRKDGTEFWTELEIAPVDDGTGWFTHWISVQRDITARKSMETELKAALNDVRRTNSLLEAAGRIGNLGHWQVFLDDRKPIWSLATYAIHEVDPSATTNFEMAISFYAPEHREMVRRSVAECIDRKKSFEFEAILLTAKGKRIWVKCQGEPVVDAQGFVHSIHGVLQDIDRQKRAMLALEERDRQLTALSRNVPGLLYQLQMDADRRVRLPFLSSTITSLLGIVPRTDANDAFNEFADRVHPEDLTELKRQFDQSMEDLAPFRISVRYEHPLTGWRWLRIASSPVREEDGATTWHGYLEDMTDLKAIEEQLRDTARQAEAANVAKSVFLSNMSHEMRTPLNAVVGMSELLESKSVDRETQSYITTIRTSSNALLGLIDDILDFSKIEAGEINLCPGPVSLLGIIESSLAMVAEAAARKSIELAGFVHPSLPESIIADQGRLRQILLNLLSNAIKFTRGGSVIVRVVPGNHPDRRELRISVEDSGIGIPADAFDKLFQRFSQIQSGGNRQYGGTGLGLAICQRLVQLMDGHITLESEPNEGTQFHVELPLVPCPSVHPILSAEVYPHLQGRRIILVHCTPRLREIYSQQLEAMGLQVTVAATTDEVPKLLQDQGAPDLFILDRIRPDFDILGALWELRTHPGCESVPVLLLHHPGQELKIADGTPKVQTLAKPVRLGELVGALQRLIGISEEERHTHPNSKTDTPTDWYELAGPEAEPKQLEILLAEDNAVNRRVISLLLEKLGYSCDHAENGLEAFKALSQKHYDVVLMDVQMPVMDGLEATRNIRKLPTSSQPFVVAVTANATEEDRNACIQAGMDRYLSKPVRSKELAALLEDFVNSSSSRH